MKKNKKITIIISILLLIALTFLIIGWNQQKTQKRIEEENARQVREKEKCVEKARSDYRQTNEKLFEQLKGCYTDIKQEVKDQIANFRSPHWKYDIEGKQLISSKRNINIPTYLNLNQVDYDYSINGPHGWQFQGEFTNTKTKEIITDLNGFEDLVEQISSIEVLSKTDNSGNLEDDMNVIQDIYYYTRTRITHQEIVHLELRDDNNYHVTVYQFISGQSYPYSYGYILEKAGEDFKIKKIIPLEAV